jgi:hypothetical protein
MPLNLNYKTIQVSTDDLRRDFEPPLVFRLRGRAAEGWTDPAFALQGNRRSVDDAARTLAMICVDVTDSSGEAARLTTPELARAFYEALLEAMGDEALVSETFCNLAYDLAVVYSNQKKIKSLLSGEPSPPSNTNGHKAKKPVKAS